MVQLDLWTPQVPEATWHPYFRQMQECPNQFNRDILNGWASGFVDRDRKFVKEFQTTFHSSYWELYIFAVLKMYGFSVDFSHDRPDFCIDHFNVEATVASNEQDGTPIHEAQGVPIPSDLNDFNRQTILRLSNALTAKHRRYVDSYSALPHVQGKPFVVAITNFDRPYSYLSAQRPIDAVLHSYYVDEERFLNGLRGSDLQADFIAEVLKNNQSKVPLGLFNDAQYKEISAVIYSSCAGWGKVRALCADPNPGIVFTATRLNTSSVTPHVIRELKSAYTEHLLDGLRIYHNPHSSHPLDPTFFRHDCVFQSYWKDGDWVYEQQDGQLLTRFVQTFVEKAT